MKLCIGLAAILVVAGGCSGSGDSQGGRFGGSNEIRERPGNTFVFEDRQSLQCTSNGISPEDSAQKLIDGGVDVVRTVCGVRDGMWAAACGYGTGEILVHEIRTANVPNAASLGYEALATLPVSVGSDAPYELFDCSERTPVPVPDP